jgi:hypothetical protein
LKMCRKYYSTLWNKNKCSDWSTAPINYSFYHGNYWQTDWPSTLRYRKTFKDSTDTIIDQVHRFPHILLERLAEKRIVDRYAIEHSDKLLDRPLSDKAVPHVTYSLPIQRQCQSISFVWQLTWLE